MSTSEGSKNGLHQLRAWFKNRLWRPFPYQESVWRHYLSGRSGLVHAPTGTGKTYAAIGGVLAEALDDPDVTEDSPFTVLWITPMRALSRDTGNALKEIVDDLDLSWRVEVRTGDTRQSVKSKQIPHPPTVLVSTPESLSILLSHWPFQQACQSLKLLVVDEWHELLQSKRGTQTELGLARLRKLSPFARTWGLSATLGNIDEARDALLGEEDADGLILGADITKDIRIDTLMPDDVGRFTWAGHLGLSMLEPVLKELENVESALLFTNTRSQAEQWFRAILEARTDWIGEIAIHHGSMDLEKRTAVEDRLRAGNLRCVVCTSTLELGVDLPAVDRVFQVASPKGVGRLMQRAGRSGHQPHAQSRLTGVPSHALEILEFAAARTAIQGQQLEPISPIENAFDVLIQHIITIAIGGGFRPDELFEEVKSTYGYRHLRRDYFDECLAFARGASEALGRGSAVNKGRIWEYIGPARRLRGKYVCTEGDLIARHRMTIGTIVGDAQIKLSFKNGHNLGTVEESFLAKIETGDHFIYGGRTLELIRIKEMEAVVRTVRHSDQAAVPRWMGGTLPLSSKLSHALRDTLAEATSDESEELTYLGPLLDLQRRWSAVPTHERVLIERTKSRQGFHQFWYPLEGRHVHEGLAAVIARRLAKLQPMTFTIAANDYGFELLSDREPPLDKALAGKLFDHGSLQHDIDETIEDTELARRHFREIARVSGLVFPGYPGRSKRLSQIQASSSLIFDTIRRYEPDHFLIQQARREVRERTLEHDRLADALKRMGSAELRVIDIPRFSPFSFPLYVDRLRQRVSSEKLSARIEREIQRLEQAARRT